MPCSSSSCLGLLVLEFGGHFGGRAQVDGDALGSRLLVFDAAAELLEGRGQGDGQPARRQPRVAHVRVALERVHGTGRRRRRRRQRRRRHVRVAHHDHREDAGEHQVLRATKCVSLDLTGFCVTAFY